jgi:uncharacterized protein DUF2039
VNQNDSARVIHDGRRISVDKMPQKVSTGVPKHGAPAHPNKHAFHHNPSSTLTAHILALPISFLLCPTCTEVIEWRKRFRKYKPLTVPKRCTGCGAKGGVKEAYHVVCRACARNDNKCAKCLESRTLDQCKKERKGDQQADEESCHDPDET